MKPSLFVGAVLLLACALAPRPCGAAGAEAPDISTAPARVVEDEVDGKKIDDLFYSVKSGSYTFEKADRPSNQTADLVSALTWKDREERQLFSMQGSRKKFEKWQQMAQAWKDNLGGIHDAYGGDVEAFYGRFGTPEIQAVADAMINAVEREYPNPVTRMLVDGMKMWDDLQNKVPVEFGNQAEDYFLSDRAKLVVHGTLVERPVDILSNMLREDESAKKKKKEPGEKKTLLEELDPKIRIKCNPNITFSAPPTFTLGGGISLRILSDRCRLKVQGEYDTKDRTWACGAGLGFDW